MSPKLPQISGEDLVKFLQRLDYEIIRQKGSHIRLRKITILGEHNITVPNHKGIAKLLVFLFCLNTKLSKHYNYS